MGCNQSGEEKRAKKDQAARRAHQREQQGTALDDLAHRSRRHGYPPPRPVHPEEAARRAAAATSRPVSESTVQGAVQGARVAAERTTSGATRPKVVREPDPAKRIEGAKDAPYSSRFEEKKPSALEAPPAAQDDNSDIDDEVQEGLERTYGALSDVRGQVPRVTYPSIPQSTSPEPVLRPYRDSDTLGRQAPVRGHSYDQPSGDRPGSSSGSRARGTNSRPSSRAQGSTRGGEAGEDPRYPPGTALTSDKREEPRRHQTG